VKSLHLCLANSQQSCSSRQCGQTTLNATGDVSIVDLRIPVVVGAGLGAFAAGMADPQVVACPINPVERPTLARARASRASTLRRQLLGIDTVTPDTETSSSIDPASRITSPVGDTGIVVGGANLLPAKVDASVEYALLSDFPSWQNLLELANSAAALLFPTYTVRGVTAASRAAVVGGQLTPQLNAALPHPARSRSTSI
jgi:hypothetical protein